MCISMLQVTLCTRPHGQHKTPFACIYGLHACRMAIGTTLQPPLTRTPPTLQLHPARQEAAPAAAGATLQLAQAVRPVRPMQAVQAAGVRPLIALPLPLLLLVLCLLAAVWQEGSIHLHRMAGGCFTGTVFHYSTHGVYFRCVIRT